MNILIYLGRNGYAVTARSDDLYDVENWRCCVDSAELIRLFWIVLTWPEPIRRSEGPD